MSEQPNIVLIFPDQFRADCIGRDPHAIRATNGDPFVETPNLNHLADTGVQFTSAYSPAPTCVPARRSLWRGKEPASLGGTTWGSPWDWETSLPAELSAAGYRTHLVGKTHSEPDRKRFGFEQWDLHPATSKWDHTPSLEDDYTRWLQRKEPDVTEISHGLSRNTIDGRMWHLDEQLHPTHWTTSRAVEFLDNRDETRPFFLTIGYHRPHQPWDPPEPYFDMYADRHIPDPVVGDWFDDVYGDIEPSYITSETRGETPNPWCAKLSADRVRRSRAAYFGLVTQIDHQLRRVTKTLEMNDLTQNTVILMASDHGEMLGDHHLWFKSYGYEQSARIPFILRVPEGVHPAGGSGASIDQPVGLEDVMPTLLDLADIEIPDDVDGRSVIPLMEDPDRSEWRPYYHGEHHANYHPDSAMQFLTDGTTKYIWNPVTGTELLFDLGDDPRETTNLAGESAHSAALETWRERLIERLEGRPEGFTDGEQLLAGGADFEASAGGDG
ncbi:MAG: arylsulfatase [Halovenus sp.]